MSYSLQEQLNQRVSGNREMRESADRILTDAIGKKARNRADKLRSARSNREAVDCILEMFDLDRDALAHPADEEILYHSVDPDELWWKQPVNVMVGYSESDGYTAIIPRNVFGCYFLDENGKKRTVTNANHSRFEEVFVISRAFPAEAMTRGQLIREVFRPLSGVELSFYFLLMLGAICLGLIFPKMISQLLSLIETDDGTPAALIGAVGGTILITQCAVTVFQILSVMIDKKLVSRSVNHITDAGLHRILKLDPVRLKGHTATELWRAVDEHLKEFSTLIIESVTVVPITTGFILAYLGQAWSLLGPYGWVLLLILLVTTAITVVLADIGSEHYERQNMIQVRENDFNVSVVDGIEKIRSMHAESRVYRLWSGIYAEHVRESLIRRTYNKVIYAIADLLPFLIASVLIFASITLGIDSADFVSAVLMIGLISAYVSQFGLQFGFIQLAGREWNAVKFLFEVGWAENTEKRKASYFDGSLSCSKLTFSYNEEDRPVIDKVSFDVAPGEYVGIVGSSGCGKSTLLKLLLGMETPQKGSIFYGSSLLEKTDRRSILRHIGIVMQDDSLIPGTLRQNLALTSNVVTEEDMWAALEAVGIADLIRSYSYGLDTNLSSFSAGMSKGQMQRILIARAIISRPRMLILDEATSALDNINQKQIKTILDRMDCTRILVAHRLSTIRDCDKILVMDKGRIVEQGSYEELMQRDGLFKELSKYQTIDA